MTTEPTAITPSLIRVATFLYRFPLPASNNLDFKACFARSLGDEIAAKTISHMDQARKELVAELAPAVPNYGNVVAAAERYVPLIAQTLLSLERARDPVYLDKPLTFKWATGIGQTPRTNWLTNQAVVWDKCMALAAKAIAHADYATDLSDPDAAGNRYTEASKQLRTGAGILERLYKEELPRWIGDTARAVRLPEATEGICEGLVPIFMAEAQQMAVGKALSEGNAPPAMLAKICMGVVSRIEQGVAILRDKGGMGYSNLDPALLIHITLVKEVYRALSYRFLAVDAWAKDRYGPAVALMRESLRYIAQRPDLTSAGVPKLEGQLVNVSTALNTLRSELRLLYDAYNRDNSRVYYDPVPSLADLDPLPAPVLMMQPEPFPAPAEIVVLAFKPTVKAVEEAAANAPKEAEPPAIETKKTDEELARELHEKLNAI